MVGPFGTQLEAQLEAKGHEIVRLGKGGWSATTFLSSRGRSELEQLEGPFDLALLELGTNDATNFEAVPLDQAAENIVTLAQRLPAARVVWIGPPSFDPGIARTLYRSFADYDLNARSRDLWLAVSPKLASIDSRPATQPWTQRSDIHFGPKGGKAWATSVVEQLDQLPRGASVAVVALIVVLILLARLS
jgi:lysophospholipase L1-like esterase